MNYVRVIPRDLFNEANLLKCLGRVYINLETVEVEEGQVYLEHDGEPFDVWQDEDTGAIYARNVSLNVRGQSYTFKRPLNSRRAWPLYLYPDEATEIDVFLDDGSFSPDMLAFIRTSALTTAPPTPGARP